LSYRYVTFVHGFSNATATATGASATATSAAAGIAIGHGIAGQWFVGEFIGRRREDETARVIGGHVDAVLSQDGTRIIRQALFEVLIRPGPSDDSSPKTVR
jgi:hypothetical protein